MTRVSPASARIAAAACTDSFSPCTAGAITAAKTDTRVFKYGVGYTAADQLEVVVWLESQDGVIVNVGTVGEVKIVDRAGADAVTDAEFASVTPTELASNVIHMVNADASGDLTAGQTYIIQATLDSVVYRGSFSMSA